jgi:hypothetical protein
LKSFQKRLMFLVAAACCVFICVAAKPAAARTVYANPHAPFGHHYTAYLFVTGDPNPTQTKSDLTIDGGTNIYFDNVAGGKRYFIRVVCNDPTDFAYGYSGQSVDGYLSTYIYTAPLNLGTFNVTPPGGY